MSFEHIFAKKYKMNMRYLALAAIILFFAGAIQQKGVTLKGTITGDTPPKKIYLYELFGTFAHKIDSANVTSGKFEFKSKKPYQPGFYKIGVSEDLSDLIILSDESFSFEVNGKTFRGISTSGSKENEAHKALLAFNQNLNQQISALSSRYEQIANMANKDKNEFDKQVNAIKTEYEKLLASQSAFYEQLEKDNANRFIGKLAQFIRVKNDVGKTDFFDLKLLAENPGLLTGDILQTRFEQYIQKFQIQDATTAMAEAQALIKLMPEKSKMREVAYQAFALVLMQYDAPGLRKFAKAAVDEFNSPFSKRLYDLMPFVPEIGESAPDIVLPDVNGNNLSMSSIKGKVILLDFWASWCGPCRHENPNVVRAYHKFKDKGFTVFSVSLDNSKEKWLEAIKKDGLVWENHVSDLKGWQSAGARKYGVSGIPATFLIDKDGIIVAKNLRGPQLEQKLSELLK